MSKIRIWLRVGGHIEVTEEQADIIFSGDWHYEKQAVEIIRNAIKEGFDVDGDTYIPEPSVEVVNENYGTSYEPGDYGFEL